MTDVKTNDTHDDEMVSVRLPRGDVRIVRELINERRSDNYFNNRVDRYAKRIRYSLLVIAAVTAWYAPWEWLIHKFTGE